MRSIFWVLGALVVVSACGGRPAFAADEPKIEVHSLRFDGVKSVSASALRDALATRASSRLPFIGRKHLFDRARLEADLERIRAYYLDHGFPDARVTRFDAKLNDAQTRVDITIYVSEGQPTRVAALQFEGFDAVSTGRMKSIRRRSAVKPGQPLDRAAVTATHELAMNALRDNGYPYAKVAIDEEKKADPHEVTIVFRAQPGARGLFGNTDVVGNQSVDDWVVRRELLFKPGDLYRRRAVLESQRKLYGLELFQFVNIAPIATEIAGAAAPGDGAGGEAQLPSGAQPSGGDVTVPMRVTVTENKHRQMRFSLGYGTEEQARAQVHYEQLNFLGGARTAGIRAKWSSLDRGVRLEFTQPYLYNPRLSLEVVGQRWYDNEPGYTSVASGGHATLRYSLGGLTSLSTTFTDEFDSSTVSAEVLADPTLQKELIALGLDPVTGEQRGTLVALGIDAQRSTAAPSLLDATRGYVIGLHFEQAGQVLGGSFAYHAASFDARHYKRLTDRLVVATRVQAGSLKPADDNLANVPISKRYYLGGATSIRGWGRYEVGPTTEAGTPIGGLTIFDGMGELRWSVHGQFGLVAFVDLGNVWSEPWNFQFGDLRYAVGPGLRYATPIGPLRVDVGYQLNPIPGLLINGKPETRHWRVHFSIGQAF